MTDREMLEFAAKAAGISGEWARWHQAYGDEWVEGLNCGGRFLWNPLTDDGDALRLAVKLRMDVEPWAHGDSACARVGCGEILVDEPHYGDDPERATRRAIVRAAAAIGESMP